MRGHRWKTGLGLAVTVILLWWVLRDVSPAEVLSELRSADPWLMAGAVAVATLGFVLRAMRWRVLLLPANDGTSFGSRFGAVCIGFMANNLLPARLGEFARAYALKRSEGVDLSPALASLVAERVFDGLVLAFFLFATISRPGFPGGGAEGEIVLRRLAAAAAAVFAAGFLVLWLVARHPAPAIRLFEHTLGRVLAPRLTDRAVDVLASFIDGLGALHRLGVFLRTLAWTVFVWAFIAASIWLALLAFDIRAPGFVGALFLQAIIGFAVAMPSSPGFFGPFEAAARLGLAAYAVPSARIVSFATSYHVLTFLPVTLLGLWYVRSFGIRWSDVGRSDELEA
ncbi:MAG: lysylphosphatidylglycerol synthase transmembrane domain-containing protein, partial [Gemmatimonadota bacterium]